MQFLNPYYWLGILIALGGLYGAHRYIVYNAVQRNTVQIEQKYETARLQAEATAKETSRLLQMSADRDKQIKDVQITNLRAERDRLSGLLSKRSPRPSTTPNNPGATSSCTGAQLYQEDGIFLIWEATRADEVVTERDYYYNEYEKVRKTLNGQGTR